MRGSNKIPSTSVDGQSWLRSVLVVGACLALFSNVAAAMKAEPSGYEKLKFGMDVGQAKKLYPKMEELPVSKNLGISPLPPPNVVRYLLTAQHVSGAPQPVNVELRFWKGKFWFYVVYFGVPNNDAMVKALSRKYGPPTNVSAQSIVWGGSKTQTMIEPTEGRYQSQDMGMMREAQAWLLDALKKSFGDQIQVQSGGAPPAAPPATAAATAPGATPAPQTK